MANIVDPSLTGSADDGMYGIAGTLEDAALVYIPVPWEVTTSYGSGAARGPEAIRRASPQLDLYLRGVANHYEKGFFLLTQDEEVAALNLELKSAAEAIQSTLEQHGSLRDFPELVKTQAEINAASDLVNQRVYETARRLAEGGKAVAVIGGDHSTPLGLIRYCAERCAGDFGLLHIDAHHDLRDGYQGFRHSHASIMHNVMALPQAPKALVQVGIRDFSEEEAYLAEANPAIHTFYDEDIKEQLFEGASFADIVGDIVGKLPQQVYVSFDIDGLQPDLGPSTGTPVAGGLTLDQARYLIKSLVRGGRRIIGFDLCEVAPSGADPENEWDGNVGARVLFLLSSWMMESCR